VSGQDGPIELIELDSFWWAGFCTKETTVAPSKHGRKGFLAVPEPKKQKGLVIADLTP